MIKWFNSLIPRKKAQHKAVLGISLTPQGAGWCVLESLAAGPQLVAQATVEGSFRQPAEALAALFQQQAPPELPCQISLSHHFYQMLLVDNPNVPDAELRDAVKWRLKDLVTQPIDKLVLDVFRLPADAYRGRMSMLYAALVEQERVASLVTLCEQHGLTLQEIGIAELALAQVSRRLDGLENRGVALLFLTGHDGSINLAENGYLYLTRTLELQAGGYGSQGDPAHDPADNLALDIQRSLDFYESQLGKSGVSRVYLVSESIEQHHWCEALSQRLPVQVMDFPLQEIVTAPEALNTLQQGLLAPAVSMVLGVAHGAA